MDYDIVKKYISWGPVVDGLAQQIVEVTYSNGWPEDEESIAVLTRIWI